MRLTLHRIGKTLLSGLVLVLSPGYADAGLQETVYDFGSVSVGKTVEMELALTNNGPNRISIQNVYSSCECMRVLRYDAVVDPNRTGIIQVDLNPQSTNAVEYRITAETDDSECPDHVFILKGYGIAGPSSSVENLSPNDRTVKTRDWTCYSLADQVLDKNLVVVDVRSEQAFAQGHIPNALNIQRHLVKSKSFLKGKPVLLVDEGYQIDTEDVCRSLRAHGCPKASILYGGLAAWIGHGGPVEGDKQTFGALNHMPVTALMDAASLTDMIVIDTSGDPSAHGYSLVEGGGTVRYSADEPSSFVSVVRSLVSTHGQPVSLVVCSLTGSDYGDIETALSGLNVNTFYVSGGWKAFESYLQASSASDQSQVRKVGGAGSPGKTMPGRPPSVRKSGGCRSCSG